jgi:hypothetical protein
MSEERKLLVTLDERKLIQKEMSVEYGTKVKHRVIDLDKAIIKIREERARYSLSPYVEIKPISPDMHKVPSRTGTFQKDPVTGVFYGICIGEDDFGNLKWQKIQIGDSLSLNLDNNDDARVWAVARFNPDIKGSPFQQQNPYYEVYDPVEIARTEMGEVRNMQKAFGRIEMISEKPIDMVLFARYLGEELRDNASFDIVYNVLLRFARNHPEDFNKKWENKNRSFGERFATARVLQIITQDVDKGYVYKNIPLGHTEDEAIRFLSKDTTIMSSVNSAITEKDDLVNNMKKELEFNAKNNTKAKKEKKDKEEELVDTGTKEFD